MYDFVSFGRLPHAKLTANLTNEDQKIIRQALVQTDTLQFANKFMEDLSGGQRQRVIIAAILVQKTDTIILDEPNSFLDLKNQIELLKILKQLQQQNKTIIVILHDLNRAIQYSTDLIIFKEGAIYAKGKPNVIINEQLLGDVFGIRSELKLIDNNSYITNIEVDHV